MRYSERYRILGSVCILIAQRRLLRALLFAMAALVLLMAHGLPALALRGAEPVSATLSDPQPPLPDAILKGIASENGDTPPSPPVFSSVEFRQEMQSLASKRNSRSGNGIRPEEVAWNEHWIDVDLSTQTLVAYEGDTPVLTTLISSGLPQWPTVTGQYRTYLKFESQNMSGYHLGYNYYLPDVPYVMYFFEDYAIHGAYWHNAFGTPMSHGCVNARPEDADWLFAWAPLGTLVNVHY